MRKPALTLALSAIALALSGSALAAPSDAPHRGFNHGPTSRADAQARTDKMFAKLDVNGDGVIDPGDREARQAEHFAKLDTDHSGSLSPQEFAAARAGRGGPFAHKGAGPDAQLASPPEVAEGRGPGKFGQHRMGMHGAGFRPGMMMKAGMIARQADTDHDGTVSKAEFEAFTLARFDAADTDHDGTLSQAERRAAMKDRREDRGGHRGAWRHHGAGNTDGAAAPDSE